MPKIEIIEKLGEGSYGKVYSCKFDGVKSALKILNCSDIGFSPNEIDIYSQIKHENIISMTNMIDSNQSKGFFKKYGWNTDSHQTGVILPFAQKTMDKYIVSAEWNFDDVKRFIKEMIAGLAHLHFNNYLHLDLKTENILIHDGKIKLIDFGQSQFVPYGTKRTLRVHLITSSYRPPEMLSMNEKKGCEYSEGCDVWGLGLIILQLLGRKFGKFDELEDPKKIQRWIKDKLNRKLFEEDLAHLPDEDRDFYTDLVQSMLEIDPSKRSTMEQLCRKVGVELPSCPSQFINLNIENIVELNPNVVRKIKAAIDKRKNEANFGTFVQAMELTYRIISIKNLTQEELQYHVFIGCLNMAYLMNEKSYVDFDMFGTNIEDTYGIIWSIILSSSKCKLRTSRPTLVSEKSYEDIKRCLFDAKEFVSLKIEEGPINIMTK